MSARRIRQLLIGVVAVLALFVSSVSACACSHHAPEPQLERSCHGPSAPAHDDPPKIVEGPSISESCVCVPSATRLSVKAEGFNLKKQASSTTSGHQLKTATFYSLTPEFRLGSVVQAYDEQLSESASARGPPLF